MAYTTIDDPSVYFQIALYTGNQTARSITNDGNSDLQPDWVWDKNRTTSGYHHNLYDSTRGTGKQLRVNTTDVEITQAQGLTAFNSDGFSLGTDDSSNKTSSEYVAWQWKANGGTTSSNSDGSITSTVQANTTAGFSIVTYTGTGSNATVGHGLGATPKFVVVKNRDSSGNSWFTHLTNILSDDGKILFFNNTDGESTNATAFNSTAPTSSVFSVGTNTGTNANTDDYVAYCFAEKQGYSKFGSYTGNGNADGTFVYTGFKPAMIIGKKSSADGNSWWIMDNKRPGHNVIQNYLQNNANDAESTGSNNLDFLSNGFKVRRTGGFINDSGATYIYMGFAEHPFVSSEGVPTTAR